mgnify:CR=1 FL=1
MFFIWEMNRNALSQHAEAWWSCLRRLHGQQTDSAWRGQPKNLFSGKLPDLNDNDANEKLILHKAFMRDFRFIYKISNIRNHLRKLHHHPFFSLLKRWILLKFIYPVHKTVDCFVDFPENRENVFIAEFFAISWPNYDKKVWNTILPFQKRMETRLPVLSPARQ